MNFVPKEKSKEAIDNLLKRRQKRSDEREAEKRRKVLSEKDLLIVTNF